MKEINFIGRHENTYLFESEGEAIICTSDDEQITIPNNAVLTIDFGNNIIWKAKDGKWKKDATQ